MHIRCIRKELRSADKEEGSDESNEAVCSEFGRAADLVQTKKMFWTESNKKIVSCSSQTTMSGVRDY